MNRMTPSIACLILAISGAAIGGEKKSFEYPIIGVYADFSQGMEDAGVDILFPSIYYYRTKDYKVEVSIDDAKYTEVSRGTLPNDGDTWTEVSFPPVPARYIRFTGIEGYHLPGTVGLMELQVY